MEYTLVIVVAIALFFDFTNGFHDTANAIATVISTKAVPPKVAVIGAAILNFLGAFISLNVAATIAKGIVLPEAISLTTILSGLVGAIVWNLITWRFGLPSSSSHALIGGIIGASVMAVGLDVVQWGGVGSKVLVPSLFSPFLGMAGAALLVFVIIRIVKRFPPAKVDRVFRRMQLFSGGFIALTHGTNDAQKTMGVIVLALATAYPGQEWGVPLWVIIASATALAAGTYTGGWRIIDTLGKKITTLTPQQGFAAETSTSAMLLAASHYGLPVSTTHTVSGSILGAGAAADHKSVNWKVVKHILAAWVVTIPAAAVMGGMAEIITVLPYGTGILLLLTIMTSLAIYVTRDWTREEYFQVRQLLAILRRRRQS